MLLFPSNVCNTTNKTIKIMNKRFLQLCMAAVILLSGAAFYQVNAQTHSAKSIARGESMNFKDYTEIHLNGSVDVIYTQSNEYSFEIVSDHSSSNIVKASVSNGVLSVGLNSSIISKLKNSLYDVKVYISSPKLNAVRVNGSGEFQVRGGLVCDKDFNLELKGSGDFDCHRLEADNLFVTLLGSGDIDVKGIVAKTAKVKLNGSGDVDLSGQVNFSDYDLIGSGDISAEKLYAKKVSAVVRGSGDIECYASEAIEYFMRGSGDIRWRGTSNATKVKR